jgi:L-histidine Nalpha-methyltransferase
MDGRVIGGRTVICDEAIIDDRICIEDHSSRSHDRSPLGDILKGLMNDPREISSRFFYDDRGSKLFDQICDLDEYYLTRTETAILDDHANEIIHDVRDMDIIEFGSGSGDKISILLRAMTLEQRTSIRYVPFDISYHALLDSARTLTKRFPELTVHGVVGDFITEAHLIPPDRPKLFCFLGSTIGNISREESIRFMNGCAGFMDPGDSFLLGIDMVKDIDVLERAYNDNRGLTSDFNRNILNSVNTHASTDFDPDVFEHIAFFNREKGRIEMHLRSTVDQIVSSPHLDVPIHVRKGELIHTENSYKFTDGFIHAISAHSGLEIQNTYSDDQGWFSLIHFRKGGES